MATLKDLGLSEASLGKLVKEAASKETKLKADRLKYAKEDLARAVLRLIRLKAGEDDSGLM